MSQLFYYRKGIAVAGTVTALVIQKKNKDRINIFIDDNFSFGLTLNATLALKKGQYLSDEDILVLKHTDATEQAYQKTLHFLSFRARSRWEVEDYLRKKAVDEAIIEQVVARLFRQHYLDDAAFGQQWVASRNRSKPKGKRALRYELRQKGLANTDIEHAIANVDEEALAWQAVQKKYSRWKSLDKQTRRQKLTAYLARRGFNFDAISTVIAKVETILASEADTY